MTTMRRRIGKPESFGWVKVGSHKLMINGTPMCTTSWENPEGFLVCLLADSIIERFGDGSFIASYGGTAVAIEKPCR
jgi:hypothetical protein